jgi:hypothetical protein
MRRHECCLAKCQGYRETAGIQSIDLTPYSLAEDCRITSNNRVFGNEGPPIKADEDS